MRAVLALLALLMSLAPSRAALSRADLASVSASPPSHARLDLRLAARDVTGARRTIGAILGGRPAFVVFADYTCNTLCGTELALLGAGIVHAHIDPAAYRIVVIGIDPKDTPQSALHMATSELPPAIRANAALLLPDEDIIRRATSALGFHYVYDAAIDQYAHPAVVYAIAPDGALRAVLSPLALDPGNLKTALYASAAEGSFYEQLHLLCYAYDPATGIYTLRISTILRIACLLTVLLMACSVFLLVARARKTT